MVMLPTRWGPIRSRSWLPGTGSPENLLAVFHDDLRFYGANGAAAYYHNDGSRFIVQYQNVSKYGQASTSIMNFEVILYPSGKIVYQYLDMSGTLNSATIGIQNAARDDGLQLVYNAAYVHDNMAIQRLAAPEWLTVSQMAGTVPAGGSPPGLLSSLATVTVTLPVPVTRTSVSASSSALTGPEPVIV